jgi:hypothetical protein
VVTGLFKRATKPEFEDDHYLNALRRVRLGNPPGKNDSLGDAVNWETLLIHVDKGTDLYLVSEDKDYRSQLSEGVFSEFLKEEWEQKKESSLYYYSKISDFFKDQFPDIKIASQVEADLAINSLSNSGSFSSTHARISKLDTFDEFTIAQVERLVKIPSQNAQVGWIIEDSDVHEFYAKLLKKYGGGLKKDDREVLEELVEKGKPEPEIDDDLPA